jgi:hypothetical protein
MTIVRIQVTKIYDIEVPPEDPIDHALRLSSRIIEKEGKLMDVTTDNAEIIETGELEQVAPCSCTDFSQEGRSKRHQGRCRN